MRIIKAIYRLLSSKVLMVWMISGFVFYYLTAAVWSGEAFGRYIMLISSNNLARILYCIFLLNVSLILLNGVWSLKKQHIRLLLRIPLYLGIILFLLSSFLSVNLRDARWMLLGDGDVIRLPWEGVSYRIMKIESALQEDIIRKNDSPVFDYEPYVWIIDSRGQTHKIGAFPARKVGNTYMHILNFGIAPVVELKQGNRMIASGPVALRLIPFGGMDSFELMNYRFNLKVMPNSVIKNEKGEITRRYDLERPEYHVQVIKEDRLILEDISGDEIRFNGNVMRFYRPIFWIQLEVVHDPVYPLFITGLFTGIIGLLVYPFSLLRPKK